MRETVINMLLESTDLRLRALEPEDLDILYQWENDTNLWVHGNTLAPYPKLALRQYITETQLHDIYQAKQLRLMILLKDTSETIGTIDLYEFDPHNSRAGIGILIDENFRMRSYAAQALEIIKKYTFDFLKINQLYAYIASDNIGSIRLFEGAGYLPSGMLSDWIMCLDKPKDVFIYQLINKRK